jgi:hypothetical protein
MLPTIDLQRLKLIEGREDIFITKWNTVKSFDTVVGRYLVQNGRAKSLSRYLLK